MVRRAVFLDRDGVINANEVRNGRPYAPRRFEDFQILPGVSTAIHELKSAGFLVVVVTNQPDVANGITERAVVDAMHREVRERTTVDDIRVCFHADRDNCTCRKPKPGMMLDAAAAWDIDLPESYLVGDRAKDMMAGRAAGCRTVFVDYGYDADGPGHADFVVRSLSEAATLILANTKTGVGP